MRTPVFPAALLCATSLLLPAAAGAQVLPAGPGGEGPRVESVRFEGARQVDAARLRPVVATQESRCRSPLLLPVCAVSSARWAEVTARLDAAELARDEERIRSAYAALGYPDATVASRVVPRAGGSVDVRFVIEEGAPIVVASVAVRGLERVPGGVRLPALPLRPGVPYSQDRLEATQLRIGQLLAERGYAFAAVEVGGRVIPETRTAEVVLDVVPGPLAVFGPTRVLAEAPIAEATVRRRLAYTGGDRYSPDALNRTVERLNRLPVVARAVAEPIPAGPGDSLVITTIAVSAARVQGLGFDGAVSSTSCLEGGVGWVHRHLFGAPRVFSVRLGAGNLLARPLRGFPCTATGEGEFTDPDYLARAELREPLGADTWLLLGAGVSRASAPPAFVRRGTEARIGISHMPTRGVEVALTYAPERRDNPAGGAQLCALFGACAAPAVADLTGAQRLAPIELGVVAGPPPTSIPPLAPPPTPEHLGPPLPDWLLTSRALVTLSAPALGSGWSYTRVSWDASARWMPGRRAEVAGRVRLGALAGDVVLPPQVLLFGGGPLGVRGVQANLLGPSILTAAPQAAAALGCDPAGGGCVDATVGPRDVRVRPAGGDRVAEGGIEARTWIGRSVVAAAFVDAGWLRPRRGAAGGGEGLAAEAVVTPGVGVLGLTPFGPIRADVAYQPGGPRRYPLLVRQEDGGFVPAGTVAYDPFRFDDPGRARETWRRLQFQLSMGLPF